MSKNLVIVESPAKKKIIQGYLGSDFVVESSIGHIRDLPKKGGMSIDIENGFCDRITSTQTLEYIEDVDAALNEIRRLLKNHSRFVNISTLWDYFGFHGPGKKLNSLMHEVVKGQKHPMLPTKLNGKLEKLGFKNIRTHEIPFFITKRDENSFAKFHEVNMVNAAIKKGISEDQVDQWRKQLHQAEEEGSFAFTTFAIMTTGYINQ